MARHAEAEGVELTYEQFLASFGQRNDRILPVWLGAAMRPERIARIGDAKEAEYRRLARDARPDAAARRSASG